MNSLKVITKNWWMPAVLGMMFLLVGIWVLRHPLEGYVTLAMFFAASMLVAGVFQFWFAIANSKEMNGWGWQLALGIMETFFGIILFSNLEITMLILPLYVGFWLLFRSFALIGISFDLKASMVDNWVIYLVFGLLLSIVSWFIIVNPLIGGITIVTWTGIGLIFAAIAHIVLAFQIKKLNN